jgi:hypothetical protein
MKYFPVFLALFLLVGCQKKDKNGQPVMTPVPGACSATITDYAGVLADNLQTSDGQQLVSVNADLIDNPGQVAGDDNTPSHLISGDSIDVQLCQGTTCRNGIPSSYVILGHKVVGFVNASQALFDNYKITTMVCGG